MTISSHHSLRTTTPTTPSSRPVPSRPFDTLTDRTARNANATNPVALGGDIHATCVADIKRDPLDPKSEIESAAVSL